MSLGQSLPNPHAHLSCLMLLDFGFLCDGLRFPQQSNGRDFMYILECLVSVPVSAPLTESDSS